MTPSVVALVVSKLLRINSDSGLEVLREKGVTFAQVLRAADDDEPDEDAELSPGLACDIYGHVADGLLCLAWVGVLLDEFDRTVGFIKWLRRRVSS